MKTKILSIVFVILPLPAQAQNTGLETLQLKNCREIRSGMSYSNYIAAPDPRHAFFRVASGDFETRAAAKSARDRARYLPVPMTLEIADKSFRWISGRLADEDSANLILAHLRYSGLRGGTVLYEGFEHDDATGPLDIHILEINPGGATVQPARALDQGLGLETVSSICRRHGALAAVNGGYFRTSGTYRGESDGIYEWNNQWLSEARPGRAALGFIEEQGKSALLIGRITVSAVVRLGKDTDITVHGINRPRGANEIILFTPAFHRTTLTNPGGLEVIINGGKIVAIRDGQGSAQIPAGGFVLSASDDAAARLRPLCRKGTAAALRVQKKAESPDPQNRWQRCSSIIGGGPQLLASGRAAFEAEPEKTNTAFFYRRHPRTAIGIKGDGTIVLLVVDGRQPLDSLGLTIPQLAFLMLQMKCTDALNLDGGGSTAMAIGHQLVNHPSDATGERPTSDALLVFSRK